MLGPALQTAADGTEKGGAKKDHPDKIAEQGLHNPFLAINA